MTTSSIPRIATTLNQAHVCCARTPPPRRLNCYHGFLPKEVMIHGKLRFWSFLYSWPIRAFLIFVDWTGVAETGKIRIDLLGLVRHAKGLSVSKWNFQWLLSPWVLPSHYNHGNLRRREGSLDEHVEFVRFFVCGHSHGVGPSGSSRSTDWRNFGNALSELSVQLTKPFLSIFVSEVWSTYWSIYPKIMKTCQLKTLWRNSSFLSGYG